MISVTFRRINIVSSGFGNSSTIMRNVHGFSTYEHGLAVLYDDRIYANLSHDLKLQLFSATASKVYDRITVSSNNRVLKSD